MAFGLRAHERVGGFEVAIRRAGIVRPQTARAMFRAEHWGGWSIGAPSPSGISDAGGRQQSAVSALDTVRKRWNGACRRHETAITAAVGR
jgi:hypothetical protein